MAKAMGSCGKSYPVVKKSKESPMERIGASVPNSIASSGKAKGPKAKKPVKIKAPGLMKKKK
jgi:hypothetical protein